MPKLGRTGGSTKSRKKNGTKGKRRKGGKKKSRSASPALAAATANASALSLPAPEPETKPLPEWMQVTELPVLPKTAGGVDVESLPAHIRLRLYEKQLTTLQEEEAGLARDNKKLRRERDATTRNQVRRHLCVVSGSLCHHGFCLAERYYGDHAVKATAQRGTPCFIASRVEQGRSTLPCHFSDASRAELTVLRTGCASCERKAK